MHNSFGKFLKELRKSKRITQENLANGLGVSTVYIHQLETGKVDAPSKSKCEDISKVLNVSKEIIWSKAKDQKLLRFLNKEKIISSLNEPITNSEKLLLDLFRNLNTDVKKDFVGMIYMLLKSDKRVSKEVLEKVNELTKTA
jgi:transcriptional regulator with XRE-family HTH domain|tara:strand:- start:8654 stop:9079 length:426 start_codon:yes stop_codon:yes gene_type:complete